MITSPCQGKSTKFVVTPYFAEEVIIAPSPLRYFWNNQLNGEGGIRTLGTELPAVQQISSLPLSTTQPPLQVIEFNFIRYF